MTAEQSPRPHAREAEEVAPEMRATAERLGRRLAQLRKEAQLTQEEVAGRAGLSVSYVSMLERGQRVPLLGVLSTLAKVLHTDMATLLEEERSRAEDVGRSFASFVYARGLSVEDVSRLMGVARLMFPKTGGGQ